MYDLVDVSARDLEAIGVILAAFLGGFCRWLLNNERRISRLEQSRIDVGTQYALDTIKIERKLDAIGERIDSYFSKEGPRSGS